MRTVTYTGLDQTDQIQGAIDAAKNDGSAGLPGGSVLLTEGEPVISAPLILPRTGATPTHVVPLRGSGSRNTRLRASASFPPGRAYVEWDRSVPAQAWHQSIRDLAMLLPNIPGVMAVHYEPIDKSSGAKCLAETLQIDMEDVLIESSNQYHERAIYLEGNVKGSSFVRVSGDPSLGVPAFDTVLIEFDSADFGQEGSDSAGGTFCYFEKIHSALRRGGHSAAFKGRLVRSQISDISGEHARLSPTLDLQNSAVVVVTNYHNEGGGSQPQLRAANCSGLEFRTFGLGTPVDYGVGVGHGMELLGVRDSFFAGLWRRRGVPAFASFGKKAVRLDAYCERIEFKNCTLNGPASSEVQCDAPTGNGNRGEFYNIETGVWGYM